MHSSSCSTREYSVNLDLTEILGVVPILLLNPRFMYRMLEVGKPLLKVQRYSIKRIWEAVEFIYSLVAELVISITEN